VLAVLRVLFAVLSVLLPLRRVCQRVVVAWTVLCSVGQYQGVATYLYFFFPSYCFISWIGVCVRVCVFFVGA
jgi:hypothetical protein